MITSQQVNKCLFNGNYKLGKLCGGLHKVENLKSRGLDLPSGLPDNTSVFLYFSGNVVFYIAGGVIYTNIDATNKLSEIQKASYEYCLANTKAKRESVSLGWTSSSGGKSISLEEKLAGLLK